MINDNKASIDVLELQSSLSFNIRENKLSHYRNS